MRYVGSKSRVANELVPVIQWFIKEDTVGYVEPFVGGANVIDKIVHSTKIGSDNHSELIELLRYSSVLSNSLPKSISEDEYLAVKNNQSMYDKWYIGLVGFCACWGSKYFSGYARGITNNGLSDRNLSAESIRALERQRKDLVGIEFNVMDFLDYNPSDYSGYVFYCDPPYKGTTKYSPVKFPYELFYSWCIQMSRNNTVLISEYDMPSDRFKVIWEKEHYSSLKCITRKRSVERLYVVLDGVSEDVSLLY